MQVSKHVHALKIPFKIPVAPDRTIDRFTYAYLVYGKDIRLIDSGVAKTHQIIFDYIKKTGHNPDEISLLILTHSHPDHIGAAKSIKKATNCIIAAHAAEKTWIEDTEKQYRERPVPGFKTLVEGSIHLDKALSEGDTIQIDPTFNLDVLHTPGHSKGSISLFIEDERALFTGDAVPLPGDLPIYDDPVESIKSIKRLKEIDDIRALYTSWSEPKEKTAYQTMDQGIQYLQRIHAAVLKSSNLNGQDDMMDLCRNVVERLGLPPVAVNPLVAKSIYSHLKYIDHSNIINSIL